MTIEFDAAAHGIHAYTMVERSADSITWMVLHHSGTENGSAAVFDDYHRSKGWAMIGYNAVICNGLGGPDGEIQEGRPDLMTGAHCPGRNNDSLGICLVGNFFNGMQPTAKQLLALYDYIEAKVKQYPKITAERMRGHGEEAATDCPGDLDVGLIRKKYSTPPAPSWAERQANALISLAKAAGFQNEHPTDEQLTMGMFAYVLQQLKIIP